ncbi:Ranbp2 [Symbiodinium natans]|uniref:Ranbp2 protein n=1 Tax=Symbiodinium natans TaxID=878477 RepID=A0A812QM89_9DINO|nr:Ranbp2 [Symbiodinium natans]
MLYAPKTAPNIPGATDTTDLNCRYGNPQMWLHCGVCCGIRPHFNWVIGTCEETQGTGQFCWNLPDCVSSGSPKINYVATYQYNGEEFVLMEDSTVGEIDEEGVSGNFGVGTGFFAHNTSFRWRGGDWTTKYAPWAKGLGTDGPRGVTPPAGLWILSAENFYFGAFYMLSQLGINLEGQGNPTGTNCWMWELDPVEGTAGWSPGEPLPGNLNMLYSTENAQASGCMPISYTSRQANGMRMEFKFPEDFRASCNAQPNQTGCRPWEEDIYWGGGRQGTQRFENLWDEPYVFAVVVDAKGYWIYRWRPTAKDGKEGVVTGWPGVERFRALRKLTTRPTPVTNPRGLRTDVPGDVEEALIHQPSLSPEAACLRSSVEQVTWQWGSDALAAMAQELKETGKGSRFEGSQNWWAAFADTQQNANYPPSIMGREVKNMSERLDCNVPGTFTCACEAERRREILARPAPKGATAVFI